MYIIRVYPKDAADIKIWGLGMTEKEHRDYLNNYNHE